MNDFSTEIYSTSLNEEQNSIKQMARDFAESEIKPFVMEFDESQEFPTQIFKKMAELGFLGITVQPELGGSGLGYMEYAIIVEEIGRVDPSIGLGVAAHNGLCTGHINRFGSEELRQKYVPMLSKGETMGAWGLTEPGSGSDAGGTLTFAIQDGNEWVINGSKNFITHGSVGNVAVIMAVTDKEKSKWNLSIRC